MSTEAKIKHTGGDWGWDHEGGCRNVVLHNGDVGILEADNQPLDSDADLIALASTAPHHCTDPTCPGDRNRRLLEAGERLRDAASDLLGAPKIQDALVGKELRQALAAYQEAAKP